MRIDPPQKCLVPYPKCPGVFLFYRQVEPGTADPYRPALYPGPLERSQSGRPFGWRRCPTMEDQWKRGNRVRWVIADCLRRWLGLKKRGIRIQALLSLSPQPVVGRNCMRCPTTATLLSAERPRWRSRGASFRLMRPLHLCWCFSDDDCFVHLFIFCLCLYVRASERVCVRACTPRGVMNAYTFSLCME